MNISFEPYVRDKIQRIVSAEAPISLAMITRRLLQSYGIARAGSRIQTYLNTMLKNMDLKTTKQGDAVFYWKDGQDPKDYVGFRVSGDGEQHRDALDVAVQEVANAVCVVLHEQISMERSDLIRETALKLGYTRIGSNVLSAVCEGILYGENNGYITADVNGARILTDVGTSRAEATVKSF